MILDNQFRVSIPPEQLWPLLQDLERIAPCLPGGQITERLDSMTFRGTITIKVGPVVVNYAGSARVLESDPESGRMVVRCEGRETRGPGSANADIAITIAADPLGSFGQIRSDVTVTGRVAQFGRGMMQEVGDRLLTQFAACVEQRVADTQTVEGVGGGSTAVESTAAGAPPAAPTQIKLLKVLMSILWDRIRFWRTH
ncbi:MAG: SRPBCC family protein [Candidatus Dormibacteria bacterium]